MLRIRFMILQYPDTSVSICQPLGTQHILHIIYICAQEPSPTTCQTLQMRHDDKQSSEHNDGQIDDKNPLARPAPPQGTANLGFTMPINIAKKETQANESQTPLSPFPIPS